MCTSALSAPRSEVLPPLPAQKLIDAICGVSLHLELRVEQRVVRRQLDDRVLVGREHAAQLRFPPLPRVVAPEVVGPEEAALQQVVAQLGALGFAD